MYQYSKYLIHALLIAFTIAYKKDNTEIIGSNEYPEKPFISIIEVSPIVQTLSVCGEEDPNSIPLTPLDTLMLTFNIKALHGLSQYKIDIHNNFDCHTQLKQLRVHGKY